MLRISKTKHYFQSRDTIVEMPALLWQPTQSWLASHRAPMHSGDIKVLPTGTERGPRRRGFRTARVHYRRPLEQNIYLLLGRRGKKSIGADSFYVLTFQVNNQR